MSNLQKRIADALYKAALEGDESPKILLSQRVLEILTAETTIEEIPAGDENTLRARIKELGLNQSELARRIGIHPSGVNKMLSGNRRIRLNEAAVIKEMFSEAEEARNFG